MGYVTLRNIHVPVWTSKSSNHVLLMHGQILIDVLTGVFIHLLGVYIYIYR